MNLFLKRIKASADANRVSSVLSCTRFCSSGSAASKPISEKQLLASLSKLHSTLSLKAGALQLDQISDDRIECVIRQSALQSSSMETLADVLSSNLTRAGWSRIEVTSNVASRETRVLLLRHPPESSN